MAKRKSDTTGKVGDRVVVFQDDKGTEFWLALLPELGNDCIPVRLGCGTDTYRMRKGAKVIFEALLKEADAACFEDVLAKFSEAGGKKE